MKLCVNYLEEVKALVEEKIDFIDYIKLFSINEDLSPLVRLKEMLKNKQSMYKK